MSETPAFATTAPGVEVTLDAGLLRVVLDRPERFNALDGPMIEACAVTLERCYGRSDVRAVVLAGRGRAFCSGAALEGDSPLDTFDDQAMERANRLVRAVVALDKPVVAAVNGVAAGVGCSLALASDLQVVSSAASFALTFTRIGLMPDGGSTATVAAAVGRARAMRMTLLGERLPAAEAHAAGLVSHLVEPDALDAEVDRVVAALLAGPPLALTATKKAVNAATLTQLESALDRENLGQLALFRTSDAAEGMRAFVEKRTPRFTGD
ncbi:enoyl-CoA hydratase/isomerase family protein [Nocardioides sp. ChNu-153]|uniref:enoyl-CoA hydratase-related protein n=1 Tax=unclassified Nocardioides TaxID=2615069 RepID=UPI0024065FA1|nr:MULTISPECIES: enoyl-CoA hydratase-related protein [unclassified Nocardioides]MDF9717135.1 enoyl-CoA hydratase/isomerase family protein [Nocardioides sp. ChNu-99]MDN7122694.1 enoyl-CoA hydratase/isomerase family protein [Nocardioides sp. ChNu-153]